MLVIYCSKLVNIFSLYHILVYALIHKVSKLLIRPALLLIVLKRLSVIFYPICLLFSWKRDLLQSSTYNRLFNDHWLNITALG